MKLVVLETSQLAREIQMLTREANFRTLNAKLKASKSKELKCGERSIVLRSSMSQELVNLEINMKN